MINRYSFTNGILSGIFISLGAAVFLKLGGIIGAIMFSFGLIMVVHYRLPLFTGIAGFIDSKDYKEYLWCLYILITNIIGCFLLSLLDISVDGSAIISSRINSGYLHCVLSAIGCGIIMTVIIRASRDNTEKFPIAILFGVPLFIILGFYHSIADAFYFFSSWNYNFGLLLDYLPYYSLTVLGNFIGCNIPNILNYTHNR